MKTSIVLLAASNIVNHLVPTAHGQFPSIPAASQFGVKNFKTLNWAVARERIGRDGKATYEMIGGINRPAVRRISAAPKFAKLM